MTDCLNRSTGTELQICFKFFKMKRSSVVVLTVPMVRFMTIKLGFLCAFTGAMVSFGLSAAHSAPVMEKTNLMAMLKANKDSEHKKTRLVVQPIKNNQQALKCR
jgi:hypothetical protein